MHCDMIIFYNSNSDNRDSVIAELLDNDVFDFYDITQEGVDVSEVHDYLSGILTDRMDEVIGFPVFERPRDYDEMVRRFVEVIINNMEAIKLAME